jgi:hypothetical protein
MGSVSAVEFVNYVPSIVVSENLTSYAAVDARIALIQMVSKFIVYLLERIARKDLCSQSHRQDQQELYKLDIDLSSATNVGYPVPENGGEVKIRPFIQFSRLQSILTIVDSELQGVRDFETGRSVHPHDGSRFVKANITSVDVVAGTITVDVALVDATINIVVLSASILEEWSMLSILETGSQTKRQRHHRHHYRASIRTCINIR